MKSAHLAAKVAALTIGSVAIAALLITGLSWRVVMPAFQRLDDEAALAAAHRGTAALATAVDQLDQSLASWSAADDVYLFAKDHNQKFTAARLTSQALHHLDLDYVLVYDAQNKLVAARHITAASQSLAEVPLDGAVTSLLSSTSPLLSNARLTDQHSGVVETPAGFLMVAVRPILTSQASGPSRGSVVFGRLIDPQLVKQLSDQVSAPLAVLPATATAVHAAVADYPSSHVKGSQWVSHTSATHSHAFTIVNDALGRPSIALDVTTARTITQTASRYFGYAFIMLLAVMILLVLTLTGLIHRFTSHFWHELSARSSQPDHQPAVAIAPPKPDSQSKATARITELEAQLAQITRMNELMIDREIRMKELKAENARLREGQPKP